MSKTALSEFNDARQQQITQNDARRIRTRVEAALQNPARAGVRWPFELVQNAHDAGPRDGDDYVEIDFIFRQGELVASHTGKPFVPQELAALLSGGSSKEFDDEETTGRFGTGFLVTHGLSPHVHVEGVLATQEGNERFRIELIRDGDEDSIVGNITRAGESVRNATVIEQDSWVADHPTASFTYHDVNCDVANMGLDRLQKVLPYLYATCERLGEVRIERLDGTIVFAPGNTTKSELDGFVLRQTEVAVSDASETKQLVAVHVGPKDGVSTLLAVTDRSNGRHRLLIPEIEFSKLFVTLPIAGTGFLPFKVLLNGQFIPQQERDGISMNESDKKRIRAALSAFPSLIRYAVESDWLYVNELAKLGVPDRPVGGEQDSGELEWWRDVLSEAAKATAAEPIIETSAGQLPALHQDRVDTASFLVPSINVNEPPRFDYQRIHELAGGVTRLHVPNAEVAENWGRTASNWEEVGVPVDRLGVEELTLRVSSEADSINDLPIAENRFQWLARLLLIVAELAENYSVERLVNGLLPDQNGQLRNAGDLRVDGGIPEVVKDIADDAQIGLRSRLLHNELWNSLSKHEYESARDFISNLLGEHFFETEAIDETLEQFDACLTSDDAFEEDRDLQLLRSSARLVSYLGNEGDTQRLRRCPLLTADDTVVRLTSGQQVLAPVQHWGQSEQPFAELYTKGRVLSDRYCDDTTLNQALDPLISARVAIPTPVYEAVRPDITDANLLNAMAANGQAMAAVTVRNESFGQIAFLSTDLVNRCGRAPYLAKLLFEFVLTVAVRKNRSWGQVKQVNGTADREKVRLSLRSATWPFELKVRSWVPVQLSEESEKEGYAPAPANEANLRELYEPSWLKDNPDAMVLLHEVFGFRQLTLLIDDLDAEEESDLVTLLGERELLGSVIRNRELLKSADKNPEVASLLSDVSPEEVQEIRRELKERKVQSKRRKSNRNFGHAAQNVLAEAIEDHGLNLKLVDRGFDYEVFPLEDATFSFGVGSYLLEVKATTTGDVRLTPLQAENASQFRDRFVLCVIDLRGKSIADSWYPSEIKPFAKIVSEIGYKTIEVYEEVDSLTDASKPIRLRNEQQLRYGVSERLWEGGMSIDDWVQSLRTG